ncbi:BolA/IbaG family iron-sulfur metabolism protein [Leptospira sp. WS92.C1]
MTIDEIKHKIESGLPDSKVTIEDPYQDGVHIKAIVIYKGFTGKSILEQHRMVYATLKEELKQEVHALALETRIQE